MKNFKTFLNKPRRGSSSSTTSLIHMVDSPNLNERNRPKDETREQDRDEMRDQSRDETRDQTREQFGPQSLDQGNLCAILGISPVFSVVQFRSGLDSVLDSDLDLNQTEFLIEESVRAHLPQTPSELETKLQCHLQAVQSVVLHELLRLGPVLEQWGLMGKLTQKYQRALISQLNELLSLACSSSACIQLLRWALTKYFSQELFLHPDLQSSDLIQHIDLVLLSDWIQQTQDKILQFLKEEVSSQLDHILTLETQHLPCDTPELYVSTYVDVIQCIDASPSAVEAFSSSLSLKLSDLCLQQLLPFTKSYKQQWFKWLEMVQMKKVAEEQMLQFFRTLQICKEVKEYLTKTKLRRCVQETQDISEEVEALLTETEIFTQTVILDTVKVFAKNGFKKYFESKHKCHSLMTDLEKLFRPEPWLSLKEHKDTMDECYKLIVRLYVKHVSRHKLDRLRKKWSQNVESSVLEDAQGIHEIISSLCPGVEHWNFPLHFISDLLNTEDINSIKISSGDLLNRYKENGLPVDKSMPFALLQWKGLSRRYIREILTSLLDVEPNLVIPQHRSCIIA